jgi:hypothetical protein
MPGVTLTVCVSYCGALGLNPSMGSLSGGQTVGQDGSRTFIGSTANPSVAGETVTFTVTVTALAPGSGTPTGTVVLTEGSTTLATFTLGSGPNTFTTTYASVGNHTLVASYSGDTNFLASSFTLRQVVKKDATSTVVSSSPNPSTLGQNVTYTATVSAAAPGSGTPTGTVTFIAGKFTLGTAPLDGSGVATLVSSGAPLGVSTISAVYSGDTNFLTSTGTTTQTVNAATIGSTVVSAIAPNVVQPLEKAIPLSTLNVAPPAILPAHVQLLASAGSLPAAGIGALMKELTIPGSASNLLDAASIDRVFSDF